MKLELIKRKAPAVFATRHAMSERYVQVPTFKLIDRFADRGFEVTQAQQDNPRQRNPNHVTHRLVFEHIKRDKSAEVSPQIVLVNSHNGRTKLRLYMGLYRFVCANGLVVGQNQFMAEVRHKSQALATASDFVDVISDHSHQIIDAIDNWSNIKLTKARQDAFIKSALRLRFGDRAEGYKPEEFAAPRRAADQGDDLWRLFNRVQENAMKGNVTGESANGRQVRSRAISSIKADINFNRQLWNLASKTAASSKRKTTK